MSSSETALLSYLRLAAVSRERQQPLAVDKLLLLAGEAAAMAGHLTVAEKCRELVVKDNPRHLAARQASMAEALRDSDYQGFQRQLQRFCTPEQAEHLLLQHGLERESGECDVEAEALRLLERVAGGV